MQDTKPATTAITETAMAALKIAKQLRQAMNAQDGASLAICSAVMATDNGTKTLAVT
jgi:hypothetical protein